MPELTEREAAHAASVADPDDAITLAPTPPEKRWRLLAATVSCKPPEILKACLTALRGQRLRLAADLDILTVLDDSDKPYREENYDIARGFGQALQNVTEAAREFSDDGPSHQWAPSAFRRVAELKNRIFQYALDEGYDAVWLVDSDVIPDAYTLQNLLDTDNGISAGVYWTRWTQTQHPLPQVWLRHPYQLEGHGYRSDEFLRLLAQRQRLSVGGLGACTLFHRQVLEKGVSFASVPEGLPPGPMADGEDRHLCERARRLHLPLVADAWPDIFHCYHPKDQAQLAEMAQRLGTAHPERARLGDLISLKLTMLEPIAIDVGNGQARHEMLAPQYVRGRLGAMRVWALEVEDVALNVDVGDHSLVQMKYPEWFPPSAMRGQQRLLRVDVLDCKEFRLAPGLGK
jgi:GT2 family glycosyltransferase